MNPNVALAPKISTKLSKVQAKKSNRASSSKRNHSETLSDSASPVPRPHDSPLDHDDYASSMSSPTPTATRKRRRLSVSSSDSVGAHHQISPPNAPHNDPVKQCGDASSISFPSTAPPQKQSCISSSSSDVIELLSDDGDSHFRSEEAEPADQVSKCISHTVSCSNVYA